MKNIIILLTGILLLFSCKSVSNCQIERETEYITKIDTFRITDIQKDSIYLKDSIFVMLHGDTVYKEKYQTKYIEKIKKDTIYSHVTDTVIKTDSIYIDKVVKQNQTFQDRFGDFMFDFLIILIIFVIFKSKGFK